MKESRVTVVVLTYNRAQEVLRTLSYLSALEEQSPIILVDNGSSDETASWVAQAYPLVDIVRLDRNIGAAARNAGVQRAATPYVALCDDDTWWEPGSLRRAADILDAHQSIAVVTAKVLVGPEEREDPTSTEMARSPLSRPAGFPGPAILGFLAGASMIRRDAFLQVGGFEPNFFLGGEEALVAYDLAEAGWAMIYLPTAVVHHYPSRLRDSPARRRMLLRNALWAAWLRRPLVSVWRETKHALAHIWFDPALRPAFIEALRGIGWIARRRRRLSGRVENEIRLLERSVCSKARPDRMSSSRQSACL
jgi:N-acetylglucosaminyl-diphospho-decaprenol L-rhamnosyltransferase